MYSPGLGRWLSRDPIGEAGSSAGRFNRGAKGLVRRYGTEVRSSRRPYVFVDNRSPNGIDVLGLFGAWHPGPGYGIPEDPYDPYPDPEPDPGDVCEIEEEDCEPEDTGVVIDKTQNLPPTARRANVHYWPTWNGGITDANLIALFTGSYSGVVLIGPAVYTHPNNTPDKKKLKPCEYDFEELHQCISDEVNDKVGDVFGVCDDWTSYLWSTCKAAAAL
jgi:hypothetical protein